MAISNAGNGDDELTDYHAKSAPNQKRATAESLNGPEGDGCREHIDEGGDHTDQKWVVDGTQILKESGPKVKHKIHTGPLLHHLHRGPEDCSTHIATGHEEGPPETIGPAVPVAAMGHHRQLIFVVGHDLGQLLLNVLGVLRLSSDSA